MSKEEIDDITSLYCKYNDAVDLWECDITRQYTTLEGKKHETVFKKVNHLQFHKNVIKTSQSTNLGYVDITTNFGTSCKIMKMVEGLSILDCKLK